MTELIFQIFNTSKIKSMENVLNLIGPLSAGIYYSSLEDADGKIGSGSFGVN